MQLRATRLTSIATAVRRAIASFSPASLFAANEPGVWYDPSDLSTMFQDAAGTTPVTAVEQPVGLILDKSRGLVLGPEVVVNGDFAADTAWAKGAGWAIGGGVATASSGASMSQGAILTVGRWYQVTVDVVSYTAATLYVGTISNLKTLPTGVGKRTAIFLADATSFYVAGLTKFSGTIDNISVRELPGAHATQSTATSRPVLSARYNQLLKTEQFDDAGWTKSNAALTTGVVDPIGGLTATTITATANNCDVIRTVNALGLATSSIRIRRRTGTGQIQLLRADAQVYVSITVTSEWAVYSTTATSAFQMGAGIRITTSGDSVDIWGASLVPANQASLPYQRVNTATDYDAGPAFSRYLKFDGIDDSLVTPTITPGTDKAQIFAGVRKLSDAAGMLAEFSADRIANNGAWSCLAPGGFAPSQGYYFSSKGTIDATNGVDSGYAPPITNVLTGLGDISGDLATLRVNGTQVAQSTADQGTGNYLAYPLYIGRRGGTSLPFNGHIHSLIVRFGPTLTAEQITQTEAYMAAKTGVTL